MLNNINIYNALELLQHEYNLCLEVNDEALAEALKTVINYLKDCI